MSEDVIAIVPVERLEWEVAGLLPANRQRLIQTYMRVLTSTAQSIAGQQGRIVTSLQAVSGVPADEADEGELFSLEDRAEWVLLRARFATRVAPK